MKKLYLLCFIGALSLGIFFIIADLNTSTALLIFTIIGAAASLFMLLSDSFDICVGVKKFISIICILIIIALIFCLLYNAVKYQLLLPTDSVNECVDITSDAFIENKTPVPELDANSSPEQIKAEVDNPHEKFVPFETNRLEDILLVRQIKYKWGASEFDKIQLLKAAIEQLICDSKSSVSPNYELLNSSKEYEQLTRLANDSPIPSTIDNREHIIELREKAYSIGKTRDMALLLARDYYELGQASVQCNLKQVAFNSYVKAIGYYRESFKMMNEEGIYEHGVYDITYKLAEVYHSMGDIPYLQTEVRQDAYLMALAYYQISCSKNNDKMLSYYYSGMVGHKLGLIPGESRYAYLLDAENSYRQTFEYSPKAVTEKYLYSYLGNIYSELIMCYKKYGNNNDLMLPITEYERLRSSAISNVKELEKKLPSDD